MKSLLLKVLGILSLVVSFICLGLLIYEIFQKGWSGITLSFFQNFPSRFPERSGIYSALVGTLWVMGLTAFFALPIGVFTGIYLEEFSRNSWWLRLIKINIFNLAGVPSIVYGILGLALFVRALSLGRSIVSAALTLSLVILPMIIVTTCEALQAVPRSLRQAAYGVGGSRAQVVFYHVLPESLPGILTGILLSLARALGESAPLVMVGALSFVAFLPGSMWDGFTVLSVQIFSWIGRPQVAFQEKAASAIIVLLAIIFMMNFTALFLRAHLHKREK